MIKEAPAYDEEDDRGLFADDPDGIGISSEKEQLAYAHTASSRSRRSPKGSPASASAQSWSTCATTGR